MCADENTQMTEYCVENEGLMSEHGTDSMSVYTQQSVTYSATPVNYKSNERRKHSSNRHGQIAEEDDEDDDEDKHEDEEKDEQDRKQTDKDKEDEESLEDSRSNPDNPSEQQQRGDAHGSTNYNILGILLLTFIYKYKHIYVSLLLLLSYIILVIIIIIICCCCCCNEANKNGNEMERNKTLVNWDLEEEDASKLHRNLQIFRKSISITRNSNNNNEENHVSQVIDPNKLQQVMQELMEKEEKQEKEKGKMGVNTINKEANFDGISNVDKSESNEKELLSERSHERRLSTLQDLDKELQNKLEMEQLIDVPLSEEDLDVSIDPNNPKIKLQSVKQKGNPILIDINGGSSHVEKDKESSLEPLVVTRQKAKSVSY
ncbi:hypothetical protein RFI_06235, partial [Reticulomyxa filosa]